MNDIEILSVILADCQLCFKHNLYVRKTSYVSIKCMSFQQLFP